MASTVARKPMTASPEMIACVAELQAEKGS
jgi:hypothetical protein